jgi:hypothetical protein
VEIIKCPICQEEVSERLSFHVRAIHGEDALKSLLLKAKAEGMPDPEIGVDNCWRFYYHLFQPRRS